LVVLVVFDETTMLGVVPGQVLGRDPGAAVAAVDLVGLVALLE
jgi:hypothetical protein